MRTILTFTTVLLTVAGVAVAQDQQVGTVTSSAPFQLRGATLTPGRGVPSWPVMSGDSIKALSTQALIVFNDGSVVALHAGSTARIDIINNVPMFQLVSGSANYSLKTQGALKLMASAHQVSPNGLTGTLNAKGADKVAGGFWTPAHTAIVAGAGIGAATAIGLGVASANNSGSAVSPSH